MIVKNYLKLFKQVNKIDPVAAQYMLQCLADEDEAEKVELDPSKDNLADAFVWAYTPQGNDYWFNICGKLTPTPLKKFVVDTVQVIRHRYYIEDENKAGVADGITMESLEPFSSKCLEEQIVSITEVDEYSTETSSDVNAATYKWDGERRTYDMIVRWDLAK